MTIALSVLVTIEMLNALNRFGFTDNWYIKLITNSLQFERKSESFEDASMEKQMAVGSNRLVHVSTYTNFVYPFVGCKFNICQECAEHYLILMVMVHAYLLVCSIISNRF